jgi:tyrocidine synthetase-3
MKPINNRERLEDIAAAASHFSREKNYWLNKLAGEPVKCFFPFDRKPADSTGETGLISTYRKAGIPFTFPPDILNGLTALSRGIDYTLHMILVSALTALIDKYTRYTANGDIITGSPIYRQDIEGKFLNTVLVLRNRITGNMTFKDLLLAVKQTVLEANENQNYPIERLLYQLNMPVDEGDFPLFDITLLLENIHDKRYIRHIKTNIDFSFHRTGNDIRGLVEYNSLLYRQETIERIITRYVCLLEQGIADVNVKIDDIEILSEEEKKQLLIDFNDTGEDFPLGQTIHYLFEEQVGKTADKIATVGSVQRLGECVALTYRELNERADQLAHLLRKKGVKPGTIVGLMVERRVEMVVGLLGILKAGGGYLPIGTQYPDERKRYMLENSRIKLLLADGKDKGIPGVPGGEIEILDIDARDIYASAAGKTDPRHINESSDLMYVIYTSGSTGRPKGIMIEHRNMVNLIINNYRHTTIDSRKILQFHTISFDASIHEICYALLSGGELILADQDAVTDIPVLFGLIEKNRIMTLFLPMAVLRLIFNEPRYIGIFPCCVRHIQTAGEQVVISETFGRYLKEHHIYLHNHYGPAETHVVTTFTRDPGGEIPGLPPIGKPIMNTSIHILDRQMNLLPVGVVGELYIKGMQVGRGYLNNPELTAEKFDQDLGGGTPSPKRIPNHKLQITKKTTHQLARINEKFLRGGPGGAVFSKSAPPGRRRLYKTGDLACWLADGNIRFMGRVDQQVKIRGFRIEPGEIENRLMGFDAIVEALVIPREDEKGDKYLCAYVVPEPGRKLDSSGLRERLLEVIPDYMVPSCIVQLEGIPVTPNGKVDRRALPVPEAAQGVEYAAPRDEVEKTLAETWAGVLHIKSKNIGIDSNFFDLGGHSLKAAILTEEIHKVFNVRVSLAELFEARSIRRLAKYIRRTEQEEFLPVEPTEEMDYYPLSPAQKRMYVMYQVDETGTSYNLPVILKLEGTLNKDRLKELFGRLVDRHESFRTCFVLKGDEPVQRIRKDVGIDIEFFNEEKVDHIIENFIRFFDLSRAPLLRVGLAETGDYTHLLLVDMHHIISDGTSMGILVEEFMSLYGGEEIPGLKFQYKDFIRWRPRGELVEREEIKKQERYWLEAFEGELPVLHLPLDYQRPYIRRFAGNRVDFKIGRAETGKLIELAAGEDATLYMVLLAAYTILLSKLSSQQDIVVGVPAAGRRHTDLQHIVGMFVNTLALRNYPKAEKGFTGFLGEVREHLLKAMENQDFQFDDLVGRLVEDRDPGRNPLFDAAFSFQNMYIPGISIPALKLELYNYEYNKSKFDLNLAGEEKEGRLVFTLEYGSELFKTETIHRFISYLKVIISSVLENPGQFIGEIEILSREEKKRLLYDFNDTKAGYPVDKTIHRLFAEQVERTPDHVALVGEKLQNTKYKIQTKYKSQITNYKQIHLTYKELNEQSNRVARFLIEEGVLADSIVGIMVERSIEMIIGILGILKAGGAYLPIDPEYPQERIDYMLTDSAARLLVTTGDISSSASSAVKNFLPATGHWQPATSLAYIIYTSGSTGRPKGVMVEHNSVVNVCSALHKEYPFMESDGCLLKTSYLFDVSVTELFGWFFGGGRLAVLESGAEKDPERIISFIKDRRITHINFVPSMFGVFAASLSRENIDHLSRLKYIFLAGEVLPPFMVERFRAINSNTRLENIYGPTEAAVYSCRYSLSGWDGCSNIPIGKPLQNIKLYILDEKNHLQPVGVSGELCIAGTGLARGYLNRPELTAERFISFAHEFHEERNSHLTPNTKHLTLYKTGDLARWLMDGNIEFLGRKDHQLKIRGFRVEPGEIESRLLDHQGIKEAVVVGREARSRDGSLCAYIVPHGEISVLELRRYLAKGLPDYMIPSYFVRLEAIPLTPGGKVDRAVLPEPGIKLETGYIAPGNKMEEQLVEIWADVLGIEKDIIGVDFNFFHMGGHSLRAITLAARIHQEMEVKLSINEIFKTPTVRGLAGYIKGTGITPYASIGSVEKKDYYPLSSAQKRLYLLQRMEIGQISYNMPTAVVLEGKADGKKLAETFQKIIKRHESLRTSFHMINDEPVQRVHENVEFGIDFYQKGPWPQEPFDLARAPLLRVGLINEDEKKHVLMVDMHHIVSDGMSTVILTEEFMALYGGEWLPPLRLRYRDYSQWQTSDKQVENIKTQEKYWLSQLEGDIPVLDLPTDHPRPAVQSFEGSHIDFELGSEETESLKALARQEDVTLYMALLSVFYVLLSRLSNQEDIIIGSPTAGRGHTGLEQIIGMFVNTLALRNFPVGEKSFNVFLAEVKKQVLEAFENQEYPFENLVENVPAARDVGRNPLFDVMVVLQNIEIPEIEIPGLKLKSYEYETRTAKFDIIFLVHDPGQKLKFSIEYSTRLFKQETIRRFAGHLERIIAAICKNPGIRTADIEMLTNEEKHRLLDDFNGTAADFPGDKSLQQLFQAQAARTPGHTAAAGRGQGAAGRVCHLSYGELNKRSGRLAHVLRKKGVVPDTIVGIMVERSLEMVIGILAILKAGGAYLPLDPEYPRERIDYMLKDSGAKLLVTTDDISSSAFSASSAVKSLLPATGNRQPAASLAYVLYTSGTTGRPKGVMVTHRNVVRLVKNTNYIEFGDNDRILQTGSLEFDASTFEIWGALLNGLTLYLVSKDELLSPGVFKELVVRYDIRTMWLTSPLFNRMLQADIGIFAGLGNLVVGGDVLSPIHINRLRKRYPGLNIINGYGPTENTTFSTTFFIDREYRENIPIGKPIANSTVYIMDRYNKVQPTGVVGELWVGGSGVSRGYLNDPGLTGEKFLKNPFFLDGRVYRTGDLGRWLPDGNIEFIGRVDTQVKIRGFRIELGEIGAQLAGYAGIDEAVVVLKEERRESHRYLCAYFVWGPRVSISVSELREYLSKRLPGYMIPSYFVQLEKIPLTPNGKVDVKALPGPGFKAEKAYAAPRDEIEAQIAMIWSGVLTPGPGELPGDIGIDDNFFHLGGHSLKAAVLISRLQKALNIEIPLTALFQNPTVRELAEFIKKREPGQEIFHTIEPAEAKEYYELSSAQKQLFTLQQMYPDSTVYNIPVTLTLDRAPGKEGLEKIFKQIVRRHESFRTSFEIIDEVPAQRIHPHPPFELKHIELEGDGKPGSLGMEGIGADIIRPFDLSRPPLLRACLITGKNCRLLIVDIHHIISDGISHQVLDKEFRALCDGGEMKPMRLQYKDYVQWQYGKTWQSKLNQQGAYWLAEFSRDTPVLTLPTDYTRPAELNFEGNTVDIRLSGTETLQLKELADDTGSTLFIVVLSIFAILLSRLSGQEDIVIGVPVSGRRHPDLQRIIGIFINTLPIRLYISNSQSVPELLRHVRQKWFQAFENQDYPFEKLVTKVSQVRDTTRNPLFDVLLNFFHKAENPGNLPEPVYKNRYIHKKGTSKFDFSVDIHEYRENLFFYFEYSTQLFKPDTIERFLDCLKQVISSILNNREIKLEAIEINYGYSKLETNRFDDDLGDF